MSSSGKHVLSERTVRDRGGLGLRKDLRTEEKCG